MRPDVRLIWERPRRKHRSSPTCAHGSILGRRGVAVSWSRSREHRPRDGEERALVIRGRRLQGLAGDLLQYHPGRRRAIPTMLTSRN